MVSPHPAPVFVPAPGAAERVGRRFGLGRYCLAVGDLGPRKNLGALGAAVRTLRGEGTDLALALVGKPGPGRRADRGRGGRPVAGATCRTPTWPTSTAPPR